MEKTITGDCHCGNLAYNYKSEAPIHETQIRSCQCSFCKKHNSKNISDPKGLVKFQIKDPSKLTKYKFGLETCEFYICTICGCYVAAVTEYKGQYFSTININTIDDIAQINIREPEPINYDDETKESRIQRRINKWTPTNIKLLSN